MRDSKPEYINPFDRDLTETWATFYTTHEKVLTEQITNVEKLLELRESMKLPPIKEGINRMDYRMMYLETAAQMRLTHGWVLAPIEGNHRSIALEFGMIASNLDLLSKCGPKLIPGTITRESFEQAGLTPDKDCTTESIQCALKEMISSPKSKAASNTSIILRIPKKSLTEEDAINQNIQSKDFIARMKKISEFYQTDKHNSSSTTACAVMSTKFKTLLSMLTRPTTDLQNKFENRYDKKYEKPSIMDDPDYEAYLKDPSESNMRQAATILSHTDRRKKVWSPPYHLTVQNMAVHDYVTQEGKQKITWLDVREINALLAIPFIYKPIYEKCFDKDTFDGVGIKRLKYILHHFTWTTERQKKQQQDTNNLETYGVSNKSLDLQKNADIHATLCFFEMFLAACSFETSRHIVVSCLARAEQTLPNVSHKHIYMVFGECYNFYKNYWASVIKTHINSFVFLASFECYLQETCERMQKHTGNITTAYKIDHNRGADHTPKPWLTFLIRLNLYEDFIQLLDYTGLGPDLINPYDDDLPTLPVNVSYSDLRHIIRSLPLFRPKYSKSTSLTVEELQKKGTDCAGKWCKTFKANTNIRSMYNQSILTTTIGNPVSVLLFGYFLYITQVMGTKADSQEPDQFPVRNPFPTYIYYCPQKTTILNKRNLMRLSKTSPFHAPGSDGDPMEDFQQLKIIDRHPSWLYSLPSIAKHIFKPLSQETYQEALIGNQGFCMDSDHFPSLFPQTEETSDNEINDHHPKVAQSMTLSQKIEKAYEKTTAIQQELKVLKEFLSTSKNAKIAKCINKLDTYIEDIQKVVQPKEKKIKTSEDTPKKEEKKKKTEKKQGKK